MSLQNKFFLSPYFLPLIFFGSGIYLQKCLKIDLCILISLFISTHIPWIYCYLKRKHQKVLLTCVYSIFFCCGCIAFHFQSLEFSKIRSCLSGKKLCITGTVTQKETLLNNKQAFVIMSSNVTNMQTNESQEISCYVQLYTRYPIAYEVGDTVHIKNAAIPKAKPIVKFPSFDEYLMKENIHASLFLSNAKQISLIDRPSFSYIRYVWNLRNKLYNHIKQKLSPLTRALFGLLFLGKKQHIQTDSLRELFNRWGLAHYLARSGLHIVLLVSIWSFIFALIPCNLWIKRFLLIQISILYAYLSWPSIPFFRAIGIFILASCGKLLWRMVNISHLLCLLCLGMLCINPISLFFLDFQLTFFLTFTLLLITN